MARKGQADGAKRTYHNIDVAMRVWLEEKKQGKENDIPFPVMGGVAWKTKAPLSQRVVVAPAKCTRFGERF